MSSESESTMETAWDVKTSPKNVDGVVKQPYKIIRVPLKKIVEEVLPHHEDVLNNHKAKCQRMLRDCNFDGLGREIRGQEKHLRRLRDLMYEVETLRTQVEDKDLHKFDRVTFSVRRTILDLSMEYKVYKKIAQQVASARHEAQALHVENNNPCTGVKQIQVFENIDDLKLKEQEETQAKVEEIENEVQELHEIYAQLNELVGEHNTHINEIKETIENSNNNIQAGLKELIKTHKLKASIYGVTGAFIGGMVGGPIGLIAGIKIGGLAAVGCAIAGYTGGSYLNKKTSETCDTEKDDTAAIKQEGKEQSKKALEDSDEKKGI